jgi:hypothetical protein
MTDEERNAKLAAVYSTDSGWIYSNVSSNSYNEPNDLREHLQTLNFEGLAKDEPEIMFFKIRIRDDEGNILGPYFWFNGEINSSDFELVHSYTGSG